MRALPLLTLINGLSLLREKALQYRLIWLYDTRKSNERDACCEPESAGV